MGLNKNEKLLFLKISDGKIRLKTDKDDPQAEERFDSINNRYMYERVYSSCEGYLRGLNVFTHKEYGTAYSLFLFDPTDGSKYSLSIGEETRYFQSMVMLLPNVDLSKPLVVKPFAFKNDSSTNIGLSFEQDGKKIANYYKDWDEKTKTSTAKNGLEDFDFSEVKGDKEETKILQMQLRKFLKKELKVQLARILEFIEKTPEPEEITDREVEDPIAKQIDEENEKQEKTVSKKSSEKKSTANKAQSKKPVAKGKAKGKKKDLPY
jgi:hypothetical protein